MGAIESNEMLMTTDQAAVYLHRKRATLEHWRWGGKGPAYIPGKPVLYRRVDLDAWMQSVRLVPEFSKVA
jgi:excisionase family DNA binding protein